MGSKVIIVVIVMCALFGVIFSRLMTKQDRAVDDLNENVYMKQSRHLANSFAHTGLSALIEELSKPGTSSKAQPTLFEIQTNLMGIAGSTASYTIEHDVYAPSYLRSPIVMDEQDHLVVAMGRVEAPNGVVYTTYSHILYMHGKRLFSGVIADIKVDDLDNYTPNAPSHLMGYGDFTWIGFTNNPNGSNWGGVKGRAIHPDDVADKMILFAGSSEGARMFGEFNFPIEIYVLGNLWIDGDIISNSNVTIFVQGNVYTSKQNSSPAGGVHDYLPSQRKGTLYINAQIYMSPTSLLQHWGNGNEKVVTWHKGPPVVMDPFPILVEYVDCKCTSSCDMHETINCQPDECFCELFTVDCGPACETQCLCPDPNCVCEQYYLYYGSSRGSVIKHWQEIPVQISE